MVRYLRSTNCPKLGERPLPQDRYAVRFIGGRFSLYLFHEVVVTSGAPTFPNLVSVVRYLRSANCPKLGERPLPQDRYAVRFIGRRCLSLDLLHDVVVTSGAPTFPNLVSLVRYLRSTNCPKLGERPLPQERYAIRFIGGRLFSLNSFRQVVVTSGAPTFLT